MSNKHTMLKIQITFSGAELVITQCPSDISVVVTVTNGNYGGTITVGNQPPKPVINVNAVMSYMARKLAFAKHLEPELGFIPYYSFNDAGERVYITEEVFESLSKSPIFDTIFGVRVPKAFTCIMKPNDESMEDIVEIVEDMLCADNGNDIITEALTRLTTPSDYTVNDMVVYYVLGMSGLFNKQVCVNGDVLYEDNMDNRMRNGATFPQIYKFVVPRDEYDIPPQLASYLAEYKHISDMLDELVKSSYYYKMALDAYIEHHTPQ